MGTITSRRAANALEELAEVVIGKPGLPDLEPEYGEAYEDDLQDEEDQEDDLDFTEEDRNDLATLEAKVTAGKRQAFESLRAIRSRQLWRLILDDEGEERYATFDEYCEERWGHSRQWVTHGTNWLHIMEECERLGMAVPHLSVKAAQGLLNSRLQEAGGLRAVFDEAKEDGVPFDRDHLRAIVNRRADFSRFSEAGFDGADKPVASSYAEYKRDLAVVSEREGPIDYGIISQAKELDGEFGENLVGLCKDKGKVPSTESLLATLTGEELADLVEELKAVASERAEIAEKKERLAALNKQLKEGRKQERLEKKALEDELKAKGALKPKALRSKPVVQGGPSVYEPGEEEEEDDEPEPWDSVSQVYQSLDAALQDLEEALEWTLPEEVGELQAILLKAEECESKLTQLVGNVKDLIAEGPSDNTD